MRLIFLLLDDLQNFHTKWQQVKYGMMSVFYNINFALQGISFADVQVFLLFD